MKGEDFLRQLEDERRQLRKKSFVEPKLHKDERSAQDTKRRPLPASTSSHPKSEISNFPKKKKDQEAREPDLRESNQFDVLNKIICPLLDVPYEEQLKTKTDRHLNLIRRLSKFSAFVRKPQTAPTIKSDVLTEYRSRDEFGIQRVSFYRLNLS